MKNFIISTAFLIASFSSIAQHTDINGPAGSGQFGYTVTVLTNGNYVITDPQYTSNAKVFNKWTGHDLHALSTG